MPAGGGGAAIRMRPSTIDGARRAQEHGADADRNDLWRSCGGGLQRADCSLGRVGRCGAGFTGSSRLTLMLSGQRAVERLDAGLLDHDQTALEFLYAS